MNKADEFWIKVVDYCHVKRVVDQVRKDKRVYCESMQRLIYPVTGKGHTPCVRCEYVGHCFSFMFNIMRVLK